VQVGSLTTLQEGTIRICDAITVPTASAPFELFTIVRDEGNVSPTVALVGMSGVADPPTPANASLMGMINTTSSVNAAASASFCRGVRAVSRLATPPDSSAFRPGNFQPFPPLMMPTSVD
jgi:hypothetical protein